MSAYPADWERHERLRDGTRVLVRPIEGEDEALYPDFAAAESVADVRRRFFGAITELSRETITRFTHVDYDRAMAFIKSAGTIILTISIALWALATYPKSPPPPEVIALQQQAAKLTGEEAAALQDQADRLSNHSALAHSTAGRIGHWIEPAIKPLGFDWQIGIGIISSFAAREVIVSTLAVIYGVGEDVAKEHPDSLYDSLRKAERSDGSKVFTTATCASLLVFYVLAMQCLSTQAVTRRETNSWKWPVFQLVYMTVLAYTASFVVFQTLRAFGVS